MKTVSTESIHPIGESWLANRVGMIFNFSVVSLLRSLWMAVTTVSPIVSCEPRSDSTKQPLCKHHENSRFYPWSMGPVGPSGDGDCRTLLTKRQTLAFHIFVTVYFFWRTAFVHRVNLMTFPDLRNTSVYCLDNYVPGDVKLKLTNQMCPAGIQPGCSNGWCPNFMISPHTTKCVFKSSQCTS